jgi:anti-anti-sigma factor
MASAYRHISARKDGDVLILAIALKRVASYESAEAMGRELIEAVQAEGAKKVVVDLSRVEYMSSVGYGPLISLRGWVRQAGGRLVLCGLSTVVYQMFEATRLLINPHSPQSLFEFTGTIQSAVEILMKE